jgi:hypothetical protein
VEKVKAIVAEIDKKQMIVLTDKGDFIKVKRQMSMGIGDEIELKPQKINLTYRRLASIAACFLACIFLSTGVYAYYTPYSYVSVDINPSIALSLNRFERVISVNPLNDDAVNLIKDTKGLKNHDIDDALSEIIIRASEEGFIDEQMENQIMVVVSADNSKQEQELADLVDVIATNQLSKINNKFGVMVEKASVESYKEALSNKQSPGKEILADRLREVNPEIKDEEVMDMSVREVVHLINEGRKAIMEAEKDKDKEQQSATNKDVAKKEDKEAAKADSKAKKDNKCSDKHKPAAAINKDNTSTSNNGNNDKNEKEDKVKADKDNKGNGDKDSEEENADKDKNDNKGLEDKDNQNNGADGQVNNDDAKDDGGDVEGKYKENNNGKKGD